MVRLAEVDGLAAAVAARGEPAAWAVAGLAGAEAVPLAESVADQMGVRRRCWR